MRNPTTATSLIRQVDPLTNGDRVHRLADLGQRSRANHKLADVIDELAAGDAYARWLSLHAALGATDGVRVLRAITDDSRTVQGLAISLVPRVCDDDQAAAALGLVPRRRRVRLLQRLRRNGRLNPIDRYLRQLAADDDQLPRIVAYGSGEVVAQLLSNLADRLDLIGWARFARLHPDSAADLFEARLVRIAGDEGRIIQIADAVVPAISDSRPDRALSLVRLLAVDIPLGRIRLQRLAELRPMEVADLLLAGNDPAVVSFSRMLNRLGVDRVEGLVRHFPETLGSSLYWWRRLPPVERSILFTHGGGRWLSDDGTVSHYVLMYLPESERVAAARRNLRLAEHAAYSHLRLSGAEYLGWDEARQVVDAALRSSLSEDRSAAITALISATRYAPDRLGDALDLVIAHANDQDPVRASMISYLRTLPPSHWDAAHLGQLDLVIRAALEAADLSNHTLSNLWPLVMQLLPLHGAWSARWLAMISGERDSIGLLNRQGLTVDETSRLAEAFPPIIARWEVDKPGLILELAETVGARISSWDGLRDAVVRLIIGTTDDETARRGLRVVSRHLPAILAGLVPHLIGDDASWIHQPVVSEHLHRKRQDLLTPYLMAPELTSRFDGIATRLALPFESGFTRWTPTQQRRYGEMLVGMTKEPVSRPKSACFAIVRLSRLPWVRFPRLVELTELTDKEPKYDLVLTTALRAMAHLDGLDGTPVLMAALGDKRARVAIYALRERLLEQDPEQSLAFLRSAPRDQVTVAKEIVRLIGDIRSEDAFAELLTLDRSELHRHVRLALLRALWPWADREQTWIIFDRAAGDEELYWNVTGVPSRFVPEPYQHRLAAILARLLGSPVASTRITVLFRLASDPVQDPANVLEGPLVAALSSPIETEVQQAAAAVFGIAGSRDDDLIARATRAVAVEPQRLKWVIDSLRYGHRWDRKRSQGVARAILVALANHPVSATLRCGLAVDMLAADELRSWLDELADRGELHADAVVAACEAIGRDHSSHRGHYIYVDSFNGRYTPGTRRRWVELESVIREIGERSGRTGGTMAAVEAALVGSNDPGVRRVALAALLADADSDGGWTAERRARLDSYREDPALLVRAAAEFTVVPPLDEDAAMIEAAE